MQLVQHFRTAPRPLGMGLRPVRSQLTDREWEVLDLLSGGASNEDIARLLVLSHREPVRSHLDEPLPQACGAQAAASRRSRPPAGCASSGRWRPRS